MRVRPLRIFLASRLLLIAGVSFYVFGSTSFRFFIDKKVEVQCVVPAAGDQRGKPIVSCLE
jgi:hypothetical protein